MAQPTFARASSVKSNKYKALCFLCNQMVPEEEGQLTRVEDQWKVSHVGDCPKNWLDIPDGHYTITLDGEKKTFRVSTQSIHDSFKPGHRILAHRNVEENLRLQPASSQEYQSFAHLDDKGNVQIWKRFSDRGDLLRQAHALVKGDLSAAREFYAIDG